MVLSPKVAEPAVVPILLLMLALAWADASGRIPAGVTPNWSAIVKACFSPALLPIHLTVVAAVGLGVRGRDVRDADASSADSAIALAPPGAVAMCGGGISCGTSSGAACGCAKSDDKGQPERKAACGCGSSAEGKNSEPKTGNFATEAPREGDHPKPRRLAPAPTLPTGPPTKPSPQRTQSRSLPGVGSKGRPLPFIPKPNLNSPLQSGAKLPASPGER